MLNCGNGHFSTYPLLVSTWRQSNLICLPKWSESVVTLAKSSYGAQRYTKVGKRTHWGTNCDVRNTRDHFDLYVSVVLLLLRDIVSIQSSVAFWVWIEIIPISYRIVFPITFLRLAEKIIIRNHGLCLPLLQLLRTFVPFVHKNILRLLH